MVIGINISSIPTLRETFQVFLSKLSSIEYLQELDLMPTQMICSSLPAENELPRNKFNFKYTRNGCRKSQRIRVGAFFFKSAY